MGWVTDDGRHEDSGAKTFADGGLVTEPLAEVHAQVAHVAELTVVRHGQSVANAAFAAALAAGLAEHGLSGRDADCELSPTGWEQAARLGRRLADLPAERRPQVALCSPYLRARQTWERAAEVAAGLGVACPAPSIDARLRDREMGELELLTPAMIAVRFPREAPRLAAAGEFFYRPPGGESFMDVAARLCRLLNDTNTRHHGQRVLLVAHDAVVLMLRYLIENLTISDLAAISGSAPVANASITRFENLAGRLRLVQYNVTTHLTP